MCYVLITPVKDEEKYIAATINSVLFQTVTPIKWVIVDDGSSDSSLSIVQNAVAGIDFISVVSRKSESRDFASKVYAIREGYNLIKTLDFEFIGNLDADITIESDYYGNLIEDLRCDKMLGITGGCVWELINNRWVFVHSNPGWCVGGNAQLIRRMCYEATGGYLPVKHGGEDTVLEYIARDKGWTVRANEKLKIYHHKATFLPQHNKLKRAYQMGRLDYLVGSSFIFVMMKSLKRFKAVPFVFSGLMHLCGYLSLYISQQKKDVSGQIAKKIVKQQKQRLLADFKKVLRKIAGRQEYL